MTAANYVIRGGIEGKQRLDVLSRALWPTTDAALKRSALAPGMTCLDLGCGAGAVTVEIARMVGAQGRVRGVDYDAVKVGFAREAAEVLGLTHLEFQQLDVREWNEESQYDFIYSRFLLTHLPDPVAVLERMRRAARPGGTLLIEDIDFSGHVWHPAGAALEKYVQLYQSVASRRGCDANIGPKLHGMLRAAGWHDLQLNIVQPAHHSGEGKHMALLTLRNIAEAVIAEQLATPEELEQTLAELEQYTADPHSLISLPRIFQWQARRS